jgi:hypothetical protein
MGLRRATGAGGDVASLPPFPWATTLRRTEELLGFCQKTAEFLRAVSKLQILDGQFLTVEFAATNFVTVRHTLGRPYNGAILVATSNTTGMPGVTAFDSRILAKVGIDPAQFIQLGGHTSFTARIVVWVF